MKTDNFLSYYKPYKGIFAADMFFACLGAGITLILPMIIRYITSEVIYRAPDEALRTILMLTGLMVVMILIEFGCNYFIAYYGHIMGAKIEYTMRGQIFAHYQKLSFRFFDNQKVGQLMSRVTNDLFDISELFHHGPEDLVISCIKLIGSLAILISVNWVLALTAFALVPFMILFAIYYNRKMKKAFVKNRARIADINAGMEDNLSGIRVVKSFSNEDMELEKFDRNNSRFVESKRESYRYMGIYHSGLTAFTTLINVAVIAGGAVCLTQSLITVNDLITFLLYVNNFTEPIRKLVSVTEQFQNGASGYSRFREIMNIEPDITDKKDAKELKNIRGDVEFDNVSFRYEEAKEKVLSNINLRVPAGQYVALVGTSGVGKTTLCSLLPRFYDVTEGSVRVDGTDIRDVTLKSLRSGIGIVQQDVYLFAGTVMDNIGYGRPGATEEEIIEAARQANAHDFIMELPEGYHTDIGQRGVKLSGGQKQRLSIARVFLKNPAILIFDEATSALDNESERVVQESLERLAYNRTTFVIAHRLSTIHNAERILVLTDHGIAEEGNHNELIEKNGIYAGLYNLQFAPLS